MFLNEAFPGKNYYIKNLHTKGVLRHRMRDLGIVEGTRVKRLFSAPFGDPVAYLVRGTVLALRNEQAKEIEIGTVRDNE